MVKRLVRLLVLAVPPLPSPLQVLDGLLWEQLVVSKEGGASAYVRPGPRDPQLLARILAPSCTWS